METWSASEDRIMRKAVMKYGTNQWNRVASLLNRHNAASCRQRWNDVLNPQLKATEWTAREDNELLAIHSQMPNMWRTIGASLGRSSDSCFARFKLLESQETPDKTHEIIQQTESLKGTQCSEDSEQLTSEEIAANARLSNSMGRKAQRKARERQESDAKFKEKLEEAQITGKRLKTDFQRPVIVAPHVKEGQLDRNISRTNRIENDYSRNRRPKLVLPSPKADNVAKVHARDKRMEDAVKQQARELLANLPSPDPS